MKIVCIGGGHGLSNVLSAIKHLPVEITAIVATTDNGGSTGKIRQAFNNIAWGDIRRCLCALTDQQHPMHQILCHRFNQVNEFSGHSVGNLLLLSCEQLKMTPQQSIDSFKAMLDIKHEIRPMSETPTDLIAITKDSKQIIGECQIDKLDELPISLSLTHSVKTSHENIKDILNADLILIGPGSNLTSIMPVLLVPQIQQALKHTQANKILISNLSDEKSVASSVSYSKLLDWMYSQLGFQAFDHVLTDTKVNLATKNNQIKFDFSDKVQALYAKQSVRPSQTGQHNIKQLTNAIETILLGLIQQKSVRTA